MKPTKQKFLAVKLALIPLIPSITASTEFLMGRRLWGTGGVAGLWSGDIWSQHNSQFLFDPYSFTHVSHGILLYALASLVLRNACPGWRLALAAALEGGWEILENTDFVINRYRAETISLNYYGDSIVNSMGDLLACVTGFVLAWKLSKLRTVALLICLELVLLAWTRDNLALNILMLIHPSAAVRTWQIQK